MSRFFLSKTFGIAAFGIAAVVLIGADSPAQAAALPASVGTLDKAVTNDATVVRYRGGRYWRGGGRYWRGGWGGYRYGLGLGIGYGWGWGWPGYYYGAPYYAPPVVYEAEPPVYVAPPVYRAEPPRGAVRQCWVDTDSSRGYGYWQPC